MNQVDWLCGEKKRQKIILIKLMIDKKYLIRAF